MSNEDRLKIEQDALEGRLIGADLERANLYFAELSYAKLQNTNLRYAKLYGANLYGAKLQGADLSRAKLKGANLYCAELQGANLRYANLLGANLLGANLQGAKLNWNEHNLIAELLRQKASDNPYYMAVAGYVAMAELNEWCWDEIIEKNPFGDEGLNWAMGILWEHALESDDTENVPQELKEWREKGE